MNRKEAIKEMKWYINKELVDVGAELGMYYLQKAIALGILALLETPEGEPNK